MDNKSRKILVVLIILSLALGFWGGFWFTHDDKSDRLTSLKKLVNLDAGKPSDTDFITILERVNFSKLK